MYTAHSSRAQPPLRKKHIAILLAIATIFVILGGYLMNSPPGSQNLTATLNPRSQIIKPFVDPRSYRHIVLSNKMKVLLVSDPQTAFSAAGVEVAVGSLAGPKEVEGLAHFCEHMLFMGSKKYPVPGDFLSFIANNNGYSNAFTGLEGTNYHFRVNNQAFTQALDMFAHFFIDPIFDKEYTLKESNAINSEFEKNFQDSDWRVYYLMQMLADASHPFSRFLAGNFDSLITAPKAKNIDIIKVLKEFHSKYYSANIMTLTLVSNQTLDEMEKLAKVAFSQVVNKEVVSPSFKSAGLPYGNNKGKYILFKPIKYENALYIVLQLPQLPGGRSVLPLEYVSTVFSRKGEGSLFKYLSSKGLVEDLSFTIIAETSFGSLGYLRFDLTEEGVSNPDEILRGYHVYLNKIKQNGIRPELYAQYRRLQEITFNYTHMDIEASQIASYLAGYMQKMPVSEVLTRGKLFKKFNKEIILACLDAMKLENTIVLISSSKFESTNKPNADNTQAELAEITELMQLRGTPSRLKKVAKKQTKEIANAIKPMPLNQYSSLYKIEYALAPIPAAFFKHLKQINLAKFPALFAPNINKFIPDQLSLPCSKPTQQECIAEFRKDAEKKAPVQISTNSSQGNIWYQLDRSFLSPEFAALFILRRPEVFKNVRKVVSMQLYCVVAKKALLMAADDLIEAGFSVDLDCELDSIKIKISGLSYKIDEVIEIVGNVVRDVTMSQEAFNRAKEELIGALEQEKKQNLYEKVVEQLKEALLSYYYTPTDKLIAVKGLNYTDWCRYVDSFGSKASAESVIIGHISEDTAKLAVSHLIDSMKANIVPKNEILKNQLVDLTNKSYVLRTASPFEESRDNCVLNYYQETVVNEDNYVKALLVNGILNNRAFRYLRTEKQLGYIIRSSCQIFKNAYGIAILVQGANKTAIEIDREIEIFLRVFEKYFSELPEVEFEAYKQGFIETLGEKDSSMVKKMERYGVVVSDMTYRFDRNSDLIEKIASVSKSDLLEYFKRITKETADRISVQIQYSETSEISTQSLSANETYVNQAELLVHDIAELKALPRLADEIRKN